MRSAVDVSDLSDTPVLIDRFLSEAVEVDVDVVADYQPHHASASRQVHCSAGEPRAIVCGVMEHIEEAGVHSGDSTCTIPPYSLPPAIIDRINTEYIGLFGSTSGG